MNTQQDFINNGFSVIDHEKTENKLLQFLKEHYPHTIVGNELKIPELKAILGIPFDEKVSGYGLNFVGRNIARAKYGQPTQKELRLNTALSKEVDTTQNLVLKGDNLDSLKILKNHYTGKIKCIYIDPPYNTQSDEFVYPDKFDKEETEALGIAENLSDEDFARMEFSFKTKKSHNGWLAFMYPRLLLARDLLSKDGVIFISIDDNEQANLKILCDEIFGEENFVGNVIWERAFSPVNLKKHFSPSHDFILCYAKSLEITVCNGIERSAEADSRYSNPDNDPRGVWSSSDISVGPAIPENIYPITTPSGRVVEPPASRSWSLSSNAFEERLRDGRIWFGKDGNSVPRIKRFLSELKKTGITPMTIWKHGEVGHSQDATQKLADLFDGKKYFDYPKPVDLVKRCIQLYSDKNDIILDFFAGSGTTGHAVMTLNAEDGGNRKFILCQIDEPIAENKPAYQFCADNGLPPFISSITIERLKRAGEQIGKGDTGFKVFDSTHSPKLSIEGENILFPELETDALSRIYNMIFSVGIDEPSQTPEVVQEDSVYRIGNHYYITHSEKVSKDDFAKYLSPENKVFVDGWTASLNATLQHYKDEVKIVF